MSWLEDVQDTLIRKMDGGKEERDWDKTVASLAKAIDEMCEEYLIRQGGYVLEFEVAQNKVQYMSEVLSDEELQIKYDIRQKTTTTYEAKERELEF